MCFGQQGVHCWPGDPFPNALPNLQGGSHFLALLPKVEWYLHKPGIFDHGFGPVWTWPRWLCCGGPREAPVAFTCTSCVSLVTSVIRSASDANWMMSVFEDVASIRRTSEGSWARKSTLNSLFCRHSSFSCVVVVPTVSCCLSRSDSTILGLSPPAFFF